MKTMGKFGDLVARLTDLTKEKRKYIDYLNKDMAVVTLKLDSLLLKIENELPELIPQLRHNIPLVHYYKLLREMIEKMA